MHTAYATPLAASGPLRGSKLDYYMALAFQAAEMLDSAAVYAPTSPRLAGR